MLMISVRGNENNRWETHTHTHTHKDKGNRNYSLRVRAKWFCCACNLGFLQLICKATLIFKSKLQLAQVNFYTAKDKMGLYIKNNF